MGNDRRGVTLAAAHQAQPFVVSIRRSIIPRLTKEGPIVSALVRCHRSAIIAGVAGIVTSTVNYVFNKRTQTEQLKLKAELDDLAREEGAWRSYWFEARKRLYTDVRPLLFQIAEYSYLGRDRIVRVLKDEVRPHDQVGNTALRIFAPLVLGRELQRRLTNVDLALDKSVSAQYGVIREMLTNLHEGRAIADVEPKIRYRVDDGLDNEPRGNLTWAQLDRVIELFTVREKEGLTRPSRQGELDDMLDHPQETAEKPADWPRKILSVVNDLFGDLPPNSSRVLGRLLLAQSAFMHVLIDMQTRDASDPPSSVLPVGSDEITWLHDAGRHISNGEVRRRPLRIRQTQPRDKSAAKEYFRSPPLPPYRTDCCRSIRRREGVKGGFAYVTRHFHLYSLPCGHSRP